MVAVRRFSSRVPTARAVVAFFAAMLVAPPARPITQCADYAPFVQTRATLDTPGDALRLTLEGDVAIVADGPGGLRFVDVRDPGNPVLLGGLATADAARDVGVEGGIACAAVGATGIQLFDISDSMSPQALGALALPGFARAVVLRRPLAYVALGPAGVAVVDVSDASRPALLGTLALPGQADAVQVLGIYAFVGDGALPGLHVVDVADPAAPRLVATVETPAAARDLAAFGGCVYVAAEAAGVQIVDVADPVAPVLVGGLPMLGAVTAVTVAGGRVLALDTLRHLVAWDLANPQAPRLVARDSLSSSGSDIVVMGETGLVAARAAGLEVLRVSSHEPAAAFGSLSLPRAYSYGLTASGGMAYLWYNDGFQIVDVAAASAPSQISWTTTGCDVAGIALLGSMAYLATCDGDQWGDPFPALRVLDLSLPSAPAFVLQLVLSTFPGTASGVAVAGQYLYLLVPEYLGLLKTFDIRVPASPTLVDSVAVPRGGRFLLAGERAYYTTGTSLVVVDLAEPTHPRIASELRTTDQALDVAVLGTYAFVTDGDAGLQIVDAIDATNPSIVATLPTPGFAFNVEVSGSFAYVSCVRSPLPDLLLVADITEPQSPRAIGTRELPGTYARIATDGARAYVTTGPALEVWPLQCETVTPVALSDLTAFAEPGRVILHWRASAPDLDRFEVQRGNGGTGTDFAPLAGTAVLVRPGAWEFEDASVDIGRTYTYRVLVRGRDGSAAVAGPVTVAVPGRRSMHVLAVPNPSAGATVLQFDVGAADSDASVAALEVLDIAGRQVREVWRGRATRGNVAWDGRDDRGDRVAGGVYFVRLRARGSAATTRVILLPAR